MAIEQFEKLNGYEEIGVEELVIGCHYRITSNKYQEEGRKLGYIVIKKINKDGSIMVNGYGEQKFPNWKVQHNNKYKRYRYYRKKELEWTGLCLDCSKSIKEPYFKCFDCMKPAKVVCLTPATSCEVKGIEP